VPGSLSGVAVRLPGIGEQVEQVADGLDGLVEGRRGRLVELAGESCSLVTDLPEACGDSVLGPLRVANEVREAVFLRVLRLLDDAHRLTPIEPRVRQRPRTVRVGAAGESGRGPVREAWVHPARCGAILPESIDG
jgi:hypothetical protein